MNKILLSALCCVVYVYIWNISQRGEVEGDINNSLLYQSISPHSYLFQPAQSGSSTQQTKSCHRAPSWLLGWARLGSGFGPLISVLYNFLQI